MRSTLLCLAAVTLVPAVLAAQAAPPKPVIVPQPATTLPLKHAPQPTGPGITAQDLMTRLYIFADDSMQGREAGTIGNFKGTEYIAAEAAKIGLVPAGENGTYFQTLPFKIRTIDSASALSAEGATFAYGTDWVANANVSSTLNGIATVYAGTLGDSGLASDADVAGKVAVLVLPATPAAFRMLRPAARSLPSAAVVAIVMPDPGMAQVIFGYLGRPAEFVDDPDAAVPSSRRPTLYLTGSAGDRMFAQPLAGLAAKTAGKALALDLKVRVEPVPFPARNVVGILPGSDPKLKGEYVAVGGHNDHVGFSHNPVDHDSMRIFTHIVRPEGAEDGDQQATPQEQAEVNRLLAAWRQSHPGTSRLDSIYNGADDDGTGSVAVLEIAQKLAAMKPHPSRSILFVWHVGEEKGLLGSEYFTDHPTVPRDSIVTQLNIDMIGRGDAWDVTGITKDGQFIHGNPDYVQLIGSRRLSTELGDLIERVNTEDKHNLKFDYALDADGHPLNIYCRSDHYEYARYGIPITFFTTGGHSDYHQLADEPEYIDYPHMARVANLIADIAVHVADLDHRPVVDHPKPDPHGSCRQ